MSQIQQNSVDIEKWLKLIRTDNVGPTTFAKLIKYFDSIDDVLGASAAKLSCVDGISAKKPKRYLPLVTNSMSKPNSNSPGNLAYGLLISTIHVIWLY